MCSILASDSGVKCSVALFDIHTNNTTFDENISHSGKVCAFVRVCTCDVYIPQSLGVEDNG